MPIFYHFRDIYWSKINLFSRFNHPSLVWRTFKGYFPVI